MKLKNVKVGMLVQKKGTDYVLRVINVKRIDIGSNVFAEDVSTGERGWLHCYDLKKYKEVEDLSPQYDIPEKAWLLREVVVGADSGTKVAGLVGYVAGIWAWGNGLVLVEFPSFTQGHDGNGEKLKCGWLPDRSSVDHWYLERGVLSFVNKDGSLTPMLEEKL